MPIAQNPDLSRNRIRSGVYIGYQFQNGSGESVKIGTKALILGERLPAGLAAANTIYRVTKEQDVLDNSGRASSVYRGYRSFVAQLGGDVSTVDLYVGHVDAPSGGAAANYPFQLFGTATRRGIVKAWICGWYAETSFVEGDTADTIAAALKTELDALENAPLTYNVSTDTITGTYNIKGEIGEDCPVRFWVTPNSGIRIGPGIATLSTAVGGSGSLRITCGARTVTVALSNLQSPQTVASNAAAALNAANFALQGAANNSDLNLYFRNGYDARRVSIEILTATGLQVAANGGGAGSSATFGSPGTGVPSLTAILTEVAKADGFGSWWCPWTNGTALTAIHDRLELDGNGVRQRGQKIHVCSAASLANAGAVVTGGSLDDTDRGVVLWQPDAGQQAYELAARIAAARAAAGDSPAKNWARFRLRTVPDWPLLTPAQGAEDDDINAALLLYGLCPIYKRGPRQVLDFGRTTFLGADRDRWFFSTIDQIDWQRDDARDRLTNRFGDTMMKRFGESSSPATVDRKSLITEMYLIMRAWERAEKFDGAEQLKALVDAQPDPDAPGRWLLQYPASYLLPNNQMGVAALVGAAAQ